MSKVESIDLTLYLYDFLRYLSKWEAYNNNLFIMSVYYKSHSSKFSSNLKVSGTCAHKLVQDIWKCISQWINACFTQHSKDVLSCNITPFYYLLWGKKVIYWDLLGKPEKKFIHISLNGWNRFLIVLFPYLIDLLPVMTETEMYSSSETKIHYNPIIHYENLSSKINNENFRESLLCFSSQFIPYFYLISHASKKDVLLLFWKEDLGEIGTFC